jgi:beta-xylosidase
MTVKPAATLREAQNTLTQRPFAKHDQTVPTIATTKIDVSHMKDGDVAGLAVFQDPYAFIGVKRENGASHLVMVNNGEMVDSVALSSTTVYLRTIASNSSSKASFEYSLDNKTFKQLGNELVMKFSLKIFTGNKFCLFNYPTQQTGGYVDFDWFRVN